MKELCVTDLIENLHFHLRISTDKFKLAMEQGYEFEELREILAEIKALESKLAKLSNRIQLMID